MELYYHEDIPLHDLNGNHPLMIKTRLSQIKENIALNCNINMKTPLAATFPQMQLGHTESYLNLLKDSINLPDGDFIGFDRETVLNNKTWRALELSTGAVCQAIDSMTNTFCVVYAGHHAHTSSGEGFCFTNPVAVGAKYALSHGLRVAVLDFDTHSGNGTIDILKDTEDCMFFETYQEGYPHCEDQSTNVVRCLCRSRDDFKTSWSKLLSKVKLFSPNIILVSAGFDAHLEDPLSYIGTLEEDYAWIATELSKIEVPVISVLEGGYNIESTSRCAITYINSMKGKKQ